MWRGSVYLPISGSCNEAYSDQAKGPKFTQMAETKQETTVETRAGLLSAQPISTRGLIIMPEIIRTISEPQAFRRLFVLLGVVVVLTGCDARERKVVATWRGDSIGLSRTNERSFLGPPVLGALSHGGEPGSLQIDIKQKNFTTFDLEEHYQEVGAVRILSPEQVKHLKGDSSKSANIGVFLGGMWLVPPVGASLTAGAAAIERKKAAKREQAEREVIEQLKDGESAVTIPVDYRWSTLETEYKRQIVGEETEPAGAASEERMIAAVRVPLKIESPQYPGRQIRAYTDDSGNVSFDLAKTLSEVATLQPGRWRISAKWTGKWHDLGLVRLTPEWISETVRGLREQKLHATGKPELPPAASISLQATNGSLQADMESDLALTVLNVGQGEFYRLEATTTSIVPALDGLKFEFGKLASGEGLSLLQRVRIPHQQPPGQAVVRFRWSELNGHAPGPVEAVIPMYKGRDS